MSQVLRNRFYVLGVPFDFRTTDAAVNAALADCLASQRPALLPGETELSHVPTVQIELRALAGTPGPRFRTVAAHVLEIDGPGFIGRADATARTAECQLSPDVLADRDTFQNTILATLTLFLVTRIDRQPFHAAALQKDGQAVLLTGASGTGKSTLAYAAARRGWNVLTDDVVYLQSRPGLRIWARPAPLHLSPDASLWFEELTGQTPVLRDNGKRKLVANVTAHTQPLDQAVVCLLEHSSGAPELRRLPVDQALSLLLHKPEPGFDVFAHSIEPVLRTLLQHGAFVLHTGSDPRLTVLTLEQLLRASTSR